jgi:hypothetical protein
MGSKCNSLGAINYVCANSVLDSKKSLFFPLFEKCSRGYDMVISMRDNIVVQKKVEPIQDQNTERETKQNNRKLS